MTNLLISIAVFTNLMTFELAVTPAEKETGMMYRQSWQPIDGMIFVNSEPGQVNFWMKNTYLPMTLFYLDSSWNVIETYEGKPLSTDIISSRSESIQYILELNPALDPYFLKNFPDFKKKAGAEVKKAIESQVKIKQTK